MRLLITRPAEDAQSTAAALTALGHEPHVVPLLSIVHENRLSMDLAGVQAVVVTSANGIRAFAANCAARDLTVLAVGPASAAVARSEGFPHVHEAGGDVDALVTLIGTVCDPAAGPLFYPSGAHRARDVAKMIAALGFDVRQLTAYTAQASETAPPELVGLLSGPSVPRLDGVLLFSARTAATFCRVVRLAGLDHACRKMTAFCLSQSAENALGSLVFHARRVAAKPTQQDLLHVIESEYGAAQLAGPGSPNPQSE